ncbi:hypothetical protein TVAG_147090 [Trichomonas vaginalis G3]|uniref:VPS9 domain-containing protein n=1 Tax=Trichomonas vaginalis (strain ATCC PRA-98 / G3) TaxID=412133 RepID=A2DL11_TRIV3|nr:hypothetical protein TVAGG3_0362360 [Trichomonas vaginalis G3]EAY18964.1 hypothetical protein TVAG_147090 [Trichomonas vaginalis G3]KAI5532030.1 hypothetical protein TVAGG3_0362360 [Trichomonas vaginalis G3]|eukprot:XP_001579950.1 hypothetical protein [Trichomonas vaginalis G3]
MLKPVTSMPLIRILPESDKKYEKFITKEKTDDSFEISEAITVLTSQKCYFNSQIIESAEERTVLNDDVYAITQFLDKASDYKIDALRSTLMQDISIGQKSIKYLDRIVVMFQKAGLEIDRFTSFIQEHSDEYYVYAREFIEEITGDKKYMTKFIKILKYIKKIKLPDLSTIPKNMCFYVSGTYENQVINRIKTKFNELTAADSTFIIESLSKNVPYEVAEDTFFSIAWQIRQFPWTVEPFCIPVLERLIPKTMNVPFLSDKYAMMTLSELSRMPEWPYYSCVDEINTIVFEINPFNIARTFWNVINKIPEIIKQTVPNLDEDFALDFDTLFKILVLIVFATCNPEITFHIAFSSAYREAVVDDFELSYAMNYLQGLYAYLLRFNYYDLLEKSKNLRNQSKK